jgi:hypothetical protein
MKELIKESEKDIMLKIDLALPNMSEFEKGYMLGLAENTVRRSKTEKERLNNALVSVLAHSLSE